MSYAVKNQEDQNSSPYSDWGYEEGSDFGMDDYQETDREYGIIGNPRGKEAQPALTIEGELERISQIKSSVDLTPSAKQELEALQRKLNYIVSLSEDAQAAALAEIDATLKTLTDPNAAKKLPIDEQIKNYLIDHPDLDKATQDQLNKWVASYELDPSTGDTIAKEFQKIQTETTNTQVYGVTLTRLAEVTGMKITEVQAVFSKHGITDTEQLTDKQIQILLPELGGKKLDAAREKLQKAQASLQTAWDEASKQAEKVNSANRKNDEDSTVNNFSVFKTLADIANHRDPKSLAYEDALTGVASAMAPVLAALKGVPEEKVQVMKGCPKLSEAARNRFQKSADIAATFGVNIPIPTLDTSKTQAGMLSVDGEVLNVVSNSRTGAIGLSEHATSWNDYDLDTAKVFVNQYNEVPDWMIDDHYPSEEGSIRSFLWFG